ncbi:MAG: SMI1/KNR4 family protein [Anaerolineae bacterium]|nr:SMI1/KNR4 family protein [Anaerolineae bacterium]
MEDATTLATLGPLGATCLLGITFNPGARGNEIAAAEAKLGLVFPADLREYLLLANGERWNSAGFVGNWQLLELKFIVNEAQFMRKMVEEGAFGDNTNDATPTIKGLWWNPQWIPIVTSGSGHFFCVDLDPGPEGTVGQIIFFLHDDGGRYLVAPGLRAWFARLAEDFERGLYEIVTDEDGYQHFNSHALLWSSLEGRTLYNPLPENV